MCILEIWLASYFSPYTRAENPAKKMGEIHLRWLKSYDLFCYQYFDSSCTSDKALNTSIYWITFNS